MTADRITRVGMGFDSHRFVEGRPLTLGGVEIAHTHGLDGHSDADVLVHAVVDALLGAVADGDIGRHFPDTDPAWRNAPSARFLEVAIARVADHGFAVVNVDATLILEAPKLADHIDDIRTSLARTMEVPVRTVSVKAKTAERMGAVGRGEGVACHAVVLVEARSR